MTSIYELTKTYRYFVFDLDDTLIPERSYLFSAYRRIAEASKAPPALVSDMYAFLAGGFDRGARHGLFDEFLRAYPMTGLNIKEMLSMLRTVNVDGGLDLTPDARQILEILQKQQLSYSIITNGNPDQQRNKADQIKWMDLHRPEMIIYAAEHGSKPSPDAFFKLRSSISRDPMIYIGDSEVDEQFARNAGVDFLNIRRIRGTEGDASRTDRAD
ncbi:MAG: HAD family hydrolase [Chitinophagaceae bacterium]|nr:HAD family hydrolase [Chitinophagaceae bacterium]